MKLYITRHGETKRNKDQRVLGRTDDPLSEKGLAQAAELAEKIGITQANLSVLKTGKAKAVRFSTLESICRELDCQPGDILKYIPD